MQFLSQLIRRILYAQVVALGLLLLAGWILAMVETEMQRETFFIYRLRTFDGFPYWFASVLVLSVINGLYLWKLAVVEGSLEITRPHTSRDLGLFVPLNPLKLVAVDLVAIPLLLILFVFVRKYGL